MTELQGILKELGFTARYWLKTDKGMFICRVLNNHIEISCSNTLNMGNIQKEIPLSDLQENPKAVIEKTLKELQEKLGKVG